MNSDYDIELITYYKSSFWTRTVSKNTLMTELKTGNLEVYDKWLKNDQAYNPINFKVIGMQFNDKMQATTIELEMW